jgi:HSP20 family protein
MAQNNKNGPLDPLRNFISQMDDLLTENTRGGLLQSMDGFFQNQKLFASFPVEWEETDTHYIIQAHIAGIDKKYIEIDISGNKLTISYESTRKENKSDQTFTTEKQTKSRSFTFHYPIDEEQIEATHENGLLTVKVPKSRKKRISIQ